MYIYAFAFASELKELYLLNDYILNQILKCCNKKMWAAHTERKTIFLSANNCFKYISKIILNTKIYTTYLFEYLTLSNIYISSIGI